MSACKATARVATVDYLRRDGKIVYSTGYFDINNNPAPFLVYTKTFGDTIFVVQAVGKNKYKKLLVNSAYLKIKNSTVTQAPNAKALGSTSNNGLASPVPTNNIPQPTSKINTSGEQNSDRFNNTDYLSAVKRGDMKTAQQMVDEAAMIKPKNGYMNNDFCI